MAITGRFRVVMEDVFPHGAFATGEVEPVRDFDKSTKEHPVQQVDRESGLPLWQIAVHDADPAARAKERSVTVKIAAVVQPVPPEALANTPFRPVEFDGLTVTPYVAESAGRPRVAYSVRASGMRAPNARVGRAGSAGQVGGGGQAA